MCITGPKICNGQHQNVCGQENGQSGKKEARNTFVLPAISSTLFLLNASTKIEDEKKTKEIKEESSLTFYTCFK
jgi:hypothetical protein